MMRNAPLLGLLLFCSCSSLHRASDDSRGPAAAGETTASVLVDTRSYLASISSRQLGTNLEYYNPVNISAPETSKALDSIGARIVRWPGGSSSDRYHWASHTECIANSPTATPATFHSRSALYTNNQFSNFVNDILKQGNREGVVTVNYGTNTTCDGGADAHEAAAWVAAAKRLNANIHFWTVGNEQYGNWEIDLHDAPNAPAHSGIEYASNVAGPNGFYALMKAANPTAQVGVIVEARGLDYPDSWDKTVLTTAPFDFVELHFYAQNPGKESDSFLLTQALPKFRSMIENLRAELRATGHSQNTPILLGEFNSVSSAPGKQTLSIVNTLFMGMMFGEIFRNHIDIATAFSGGGYNQNCTGNNSSTLYGWQNFGNYDEIALDTQNHWNYCGGGNQAGPIVPEGTVVPTGQAQKLVSIFATQGSKLLSANASSEQGAVVAYAATQGIGYSLMLFNLNASQAARVSIQLKGASRLSYNAVLTTYGKAEYDLSDTLVDPHNRTNGYQWSGPTVSDVGAVGPQFQVSLPPYSMSVLQLQ